VFDCGRTDTYARTYGRTDGWTFLPGLLGHLSEDDLKTGRPNLLPGTLVNLCLVADPFTAKSDNK